MDLTQQFTLAEFLLLLMSGGGGAAVYWMMENIGFLASLQPMWKRLASYILSGAIPVAAWGLAILFEFQPAPADWRSAAEAVFSLLLVAFTTNQGIHAGLKLRLK